MLQVDENIGGRQDQKNNGLRTKMLAVGLLMVVGCFVVGLFSATAGSTTAHTRGVSSPTGNSYHIHKINSFAKVDASFNSISTISLSTKFLPLLFFKHNLSLAPAKSMAWSPIQCILTSLLQTRHRTTHIQLYMA